VYVGTSAALKPKITVSNAQEAMTPPNDQLSNSIIIVNILIGIYNRKNPLLLNLQIYLWIILVFVNWYQANG
jgi:hypothetical protein